MRNSIIKILLSTLAILGISYLLEGVSIGGWKSALIVAIVLGFLNNFISPILKILTIPITLITLGFFLLVINALMVLWADYFIFGFSVSGFWTAMLFSIMLSITQCILHWMFIPKKKGR